MVVYGIAWYLMVLDGIAWYCLVFDDITLYLMVSIGDNRVLIDLGAVAVSHFYSRENVIRNTQEGDFQL